MQHKVALELSGQQPPTGAPAPANGPVVGASPLQLLQYGDFRAEVAPDVGGSLASLFSVHPASGERRHWLRPQKLSAAPGRGPHQPRQCVRS